MVHLCVKFLSLNICRCARGVVGDVAGGGGGVFVFVVVIVVVLSRGVLCVCAFASLGACLKVRLRA